MSRRQRVSWVHVIGAIPVAVIAWMLLAALLVVLLGDLALAGLVSIGVLVGVGCVLLLLPSSAAKGSGVGAIVTAIPCAIGLALSLM